MRINFSVNSSVQILFRIFYLLKIYIFLYFYKDLISNFNRTHFIYFSQKKRIFIPKIISVFNQVWMIDLSNIWYYCSIQKDCIAQFYDDLTSFDSIRISHPRNKLQEENYTPFLITEMQIGKYDHRLF